MTPLARALALSACGMLAACKVGSRGLEEDTPEYNRTIRTIEDEHMLLNLVRLRYFETPIFLQIASISTTYDTGVDASVGVSAGSAVAATGSGGVGGTYRVTPTITYSLPDSREFFGRMLAPLSSSQLAVMSTAGGSPLSLLPLVTRKVNGLENLHADHGGVLVKPASYERFVEVAGLLQEAERNGLADYAFGRVLIPVSSPFERMEARAFPDGFSASERMEFYRNENGEWVAHNVERALYLRFPPQSEQPEIIVRLRDLLRLKSEQHSFAVVDPDSSIAERERVREGRVAAGLDSKAEWSEVVIQNRSMMEILYHAAQSVEVPPAHVAAGIAKESSHPLTELFRVRSSAVQPHSAAVRVLYGDTWFYVAKDDLESKRVLLLLNTLLAVTGGSVPGATPVLTIPVR